MTRNVIAIIDSRDRSRKPRNRISENSRLHIAFLIWGAQRGAMSIRYKVHDYPASASELGGVIVTGLTDEFFARLSSIEPGKERRQNTPSARGLMLTLSE
jgi:hypothetical protein